MEKRRRIPSIEQREVLEALACQENCRAMAALLSPENPGVSEEADQRTREFLEQLREILSVTKRKLVVKGKKTTRSANQRPSVLNREESMQISDRKGGSGRPSKKRNMAVDLTTRKTPTRSGREEEENERQEENEQNEQNEWQEENEQNEQNEKQEENEQNEQNEENERQEENERPSVEQQESLQIYDPKRCCGLPLMKCMLEENEWRIKAKELEEKCSEVTKQLEEFRGAITLDKLPLLAPCKCHFFKSANIEAQTAYDDYVAQSSVQTFLRNVRLLRRLKLQRIGDNYDEAQEQLAMVIDFVVELSCQTKPIHLKGRYADAYMHHAVDFIKDTIPLLREGNEEKRAIVDNLIAKLVLDLVGKLLNFTPDPHCTPDLNCTPDQDSAEGDFDDKERILVVMLRLAEYAYIGHRILLTSSQQIAMVLERLQCMDPFDEGFSQIYENLFFMFHLVETLVAAHMGSWKEENNFGQGILEEWVTCHFHCKTTLERRPTAWTPQFMIVLDSITEKLLVQLHYSAELEGRNGQDIWQKALICLLASAASAVTGT